MAAVKTFLKKYGAVGIGVYGGVSVVSMGSLYLALRTGGHEMITTPLERVLGNDSEIVVNIKKQLGEAQAVSNDNSSAVGGVNLAREGTYVGIAAVVDSLVAPVKLAICLRKFFYSFCTTVLPQSTNTEP